MSKINLNDIVTDEYGFALHEATYKMIEDVIQDDAVILTYDCMNMVGNTDSEIELRISRHIYFNPEQLFDIFVSMNVKLPKKEGVLSSDINEVDLLAAVREDETGLASAFLSNIGSRICAIIAGITASAGLQPLITSPIFVFDEGLG